MAEKRSYADMCRFAFALDLVGERWALLVVRELVLGPKRFTDLRAGLPHASPNVLSQRLRELEQAGVIRRRTLPPPAGSRVYELTEWGAELGPVVTLLGHWGARAPTRPDADQISPDAIMLAFRAHFDAERARDLRATHEVRLGDSRYTVGIADGELDLRRGEAEDPDLVVETDPETLGMVIGGERSPADAVDSGAMKVEGAGRRDLERFFAVFPMPEPAPEPA